MSYEAVFCQRCGHNNLMGGSYCQKCGASLISGGATGSVSSAAPMTPLVYSIQPYGGFWIRLLAYIIDRIVIGVAFSPVAIYLLINTIHEMHRLAPNDPEQLRPMIHFVGVIGPTALLVQWLYEALLTSSSWQATVGKRVLNPKVTDEEGYPISFAHASGRFFAKILSGLLLCIGFLMVAFTERKQGLHDIIAETLVIKG